MAFKERLLELLQNLISSLQLITRGDYGQRAVKLMEESVRVQQLTYEEIRRAIESRPLQKEDLMDSLDVMKYLNISDSTLYRARKDETVKPRKFRGRYYYDKADILTLRDKYLK